MKTLSRLDTDLLATFSRRSHSEDERDAAFSELVARHGGMVHQTCVRILGDSSEADDAAQATFVVLAKRAAAVHGNIEAYLHRVAVNAARRALHVRRLREKHERTAGMDAHREHADEDDPQGWHELKPHLDNAIEGLPRMQRAAVIMHYLEGRQQKDVAASLGISRNAVKIHIQRALAKLRIRLARREVRVSSVVLAGLLAACTKEATCPPFLSSVTKRILQSSQGTAAGRALPREVNVLANGAIKTMFWTKVKLMSALAATVLLCAGTPIAVGVARAEEPKRVEKAPAEKPARPKQQLVDDRLDDKADTVLRGTCQAVRVPAGFRGGWPTYKLTITQAFKTPVHRPLKAGSVVTIKSILNLPKREATYYLNYDAHQKLYRLASQRSLQDSVSHIGGDDARKDAAEAPAGSQKPDDIAKAAFPDDGVLFVVGLEAFSGVSFGPVVGCEIRLRVKRVLRMTGGKEQVKSSGNPFNLKQTLQLLEARKDDRVIVYKKRHFRTDGHSVALKEENERLKKRMTGGKEFLFVMPSVMQLSPIPAIPMVKKIGWCQFGGDERGLFILEFSEDAAKKLPARLKVVRSEIAALREASRARRQSAIARLIENRDLAEPLLLRQLAEPKSNWHAALALAEMHNHRAVGILANGLSTESALNCHDAILALRKIKGWKTGTVRKLILKLNDTKAHSESGVRFVLADDAAKTLEQITGQSFGKDKVKWEAWVKGVEEEQRNRSRAPGKYGR